MAKAKFERTKPHCNIGTIVHWHPIVLTQTSSLSQSSTR